VNAKGSTARTAARTALKWLLPLALIAWLLASGKLDLGTLARVFSDPVLLCANVLGWAGCALVLAAARWKLLLGPEGASLPLLRAMRLQFIALFMNTAVPGNVAGDVYKNVLAARGIPSLTLTRSLTVVMVERVLGLAALVLISVLSIAARGGALPERARPLLPFVSLLGAGTVGGVLVALLAARFASGAGETPPAAGLVTKLRAKVAEVGDALLAYARRPAALGGAFALSVLMHAVYIGLFVTLGRKVAPASLAPLDVSVIYPIGMLTSILPLAPGGIGVGHAAFASLFALFGAGRGADVFNAFIVGQMVPNLLGVIPYVLEPGREEHP
jgi:uncharacterized membrane protein YbhN (UPF0104 family)